MRRQLTILFGVFFLSAVVLAAPASAQRRGGGMHGNPGTGHVVHVVPGYVGGFGFYDPFWLGYWGPWGPYWGPGFYGPPYGYYASGYTAGLKLKVTGPDPKQAQVFANGNYVGVVDNFNGRFQQLDLPPGDYRIEVRAKGYQPLLVNMRLEPGRTITYSGELKPAS